MLIVIHESLSLGNETTIHVIVEDIGYHYHGVRVERELGQELQVPVRKRDACRQHLIVVKVLPTLAGAFDIDPEGRVLLLSDVESIVNRRCASGIRKLGLGGCEFLHVADKHFLVD